MDVNEELKKVLKEGEVIIGEKRAKKGILLGKVKLIILSSDLPERMKDEFKHYAEMSEIPFYDYPGTSKDLGYTCAKPFPISSLAVVNEGGSKILQVK